MSAPRIVFPTDINGLLEVGIAAGSDEYTDTDGKVYVYWKATATAPREPSVSELRAVDLLDRWLSLDQVPDPSAARIALFEDDTAIAGPVSLGATAANVKAVIDNWPNSKKAAGKLKEIFANRIVVKVDRWEKWVNIEASARPDVEIDYEKTFMANTPIGTSTVAKKLWQGMLWVGLKKGWVIRRGAAGNGLLTHVGPEVTYSAVRSAEDVTDVGFATAQISANVLVGSKVTWWLINHHVGQKESSIESYAGKVVKAAQLISDSNTAEIREVRKVVWAIGKIMSTRGILSGMGITSIVYEDSSNTPDPTGNDYAIGGKIAIKVSADVKDRISAYPAGTAALSTYHAIMKHAKSSIFSCCIPPLTTLDYDKSANVFTGPVHERMEEIKAEPARYHMGSGFLTGLERLASDEWSDEEKMNFASYIHATAPNGTLARSPAILKKSDVSGCAVYQAICAAKVNLATGTGNLVTNMLIQRVGSGAIVGGLGGQLGAIPQSRIDEVNLAAKAWEEGEVSDDEAQGVNESRVAKADRTARNAERVTRRATYRRAVSLIPESIRNPRASAPVAVAGVVSRAAP